MFIKVGVDGHVEYEDLKKYITLIFFLITYSIELGIWYGTQK